MEKEPPSQLDSIRPHPAMESRDEIPQRVSPQFEEVDIRQSIRSADEPITEEFDRSDEEESIPVPLKLDDGGERRSSTTEEEEVKIVEENPTAVEEDEP
ncbi:uncharacterized protein A4U43_C02F12830 [Asparagus officinalis]|uniref:Uncharacterized protein n=1 Tax=Asparagus officinalis TaxID=4686 RepID=A0A5P1FLY2_ASPOF|nr:uncharacterized protein A4U43_C02F12830 [Asparagus officinalis]